MKVNNAYTIVVLLFYLNTFHLLCLRKDDIYIYIYILMISSVDMYTCTRMRIVQNAESKLRLIETRKYS